jgi:ribosomal protein S18 acetylase RimI-like enzyme
MLPDLTIRRADESDIPAIRHVAHTTWPVAYSGIISPAQVHYMLDMMYSEASLSRQMTHEGHRFFLASRGAVCAGFASIGDWATQSVKLHKLYVLPEAKGSGAGAALLRHVTALAAQEGSLRMVLQVNRRNTAVDFYRHHGFAVAEEAVLDIGGGFVMDDFIMQKQLKGTATGGHGV